jgi:hypothetical protein
MDIFLPSGGPVATPLPFTPEKVHATSPSGEVFGADSVSLLRGESADKMSHFYQIGGEIHLARVPSAVWREQLMRMKAGGLNTVAVYVFWIHHEEQRGVFDFTGRRNIRQFVTLAKEIGLNVLMRIGPWDHGECRNGGHPDWVLDNCGKLRSEDPKYMVCVSGWYTALAAQLHGLFHKDGGPITLVQVDNETSNWRYLLALRELAMSLGILPAVYTKTGWPGPAEDYPSDYPMLPFFGGYPDAFWDGYGPGAALSEYTFATAPSLAASAAVTDGADLHASSGAWVIPAGYPWLDIEIGGGMAADYAHRIHLQSDDMPAMHLCDVGGGVNALGYCASASFPLLWLLGPPRLNVARLMLQTCITAAITLIRRFTLTIWTTQTQHCKSRASNLRAAPILCRQSPTTSLRRWGRWASHGGTTTACDECTPSSKGLVRRWRRRRRPG